MALDKEQKQEIITHFGRNGVDSGSTEVQIAMLTARIEHLSQHLQEHTKDHHGRRGLLSMVGKRKRLLGYLERTDYDGYKNLIKSLGLRR